MTITRTEKPDGSIEVTMSEHDMEMARAYQYQERHGLSLTRDAIRARVKYWQRLRDRLDQEGFEGATGIEI